MLQLAIKIGIDFICASGIAASGPPLENLLAWVFSESFFEDSGSWYSTDLSGNDNHPQIVKSSCLEFNTSNQGVSVSDSASLTDLFDGGGKISFEIYVDNTITGNNRIAEKTDNVGGWLFTATSSATDRGLFFSAYYSGTNLAWRNLTCLNGITDSWVTIELEFDSSQNNNASIKVNGSTITPTLNTPPTGTYNSDSGLDLCIGNRPQMDRPFVGRMSEVEMVNQGDTKALYRSAECNGSIWYDKTPNANHGAICNLIASMWVLDDNVRPDNILDGFSLYEHATEDPIRVPYDSEGNPLVITPPSGYTKTSDNPADYWHNSAESLFKFPEVQPLIDADVSNWGFTGGVANELSYDDIVYDVDNAGFILADVSVENQKKNIMWYSEGQVVPALLTLVEFLNMGTLLQSSDGDYLLSSEEQLLLGGG